MGTSDAKCAARNIRMYFAFKTLGAAGGLLSNKSKLLEPYKYVAVVLHTPSHFLYSDKTNMCSPVRTLGVLPTYKHTSVRARKQAINCIQCPAC